MKSCIADVNTYLTNIIETHDSLLTVSVRQHLADKLKPIFYMLNRLEGVLESDSLLKQGENLSSNLPLRNQPTLLEDENAKLKRKSRDQELDANLRIARVEKARKKELRDAQISLEAKKALFLP
ncbi:unnamed protein product [Lactuca saligna]|uniref:Uncharacterized protein n=1 Tax=Lactuca saligna TaxID=75948 RepID=A0AA35VXQ6_LACSI|nr:unnamed protein product [Lactuca saligna]